MDKKPRGPLTTGGDTSVRAFPAQAPVGAHGPGFRWLEMKTMEEADALCAHVGIDDLWVWTKDSPDRRYWILERQGALQPTVLVSIGRYGIVADTQAGRSGRDRRRHVRHADMRAFLGALAQIGLECGYPCTRDVEADARRADARSMRRFRWAGATLAALAA